MFPKGAAEEGATAAAVARGKQYFAICVSLHFCFQFHWGKKNAKGLVHASIHACTG